MSEVADFFGSKAFANYRQLQESRSKANMALLGRFDNVIKAIGGLGKLLAAALGRRRR